MSQPGEKGLTEYKLHCLFSSGKSHMNMQKISVDELIKESQRRAKVQQSKIAKRRKELIEKDISADVRIVAWIDILGFSQQLLKAETAQDYSDVYQKMLHVQNMFDLSSASDEPDLIDKINIDYGRSIIALSDGLVVTASQNAPAKGIVSQYDLLMSFVGDILMAQARCALEGVFLRGAISIGPFYYENNILLSPALVRAYKMETNLATFPIVIVNKRDVEEIRRVDGYDAYAKDADPSRDYFRDFEVPGRPNDGTHYYLDYLRYLCDPSNYSFFSESDREDYLRHPPESEERGQIQMNSSRKQAAAVMLEHKKKLIEAHQRAESKSVKKKYTWLMKYQNRTLKGQGAAYKDARIDLKKLS